MATKRTSLMRQILKSKMMYLAMLLEVLGVIQLNADFLSTMLTPAQFGWVMLGVAVAVRILRMMTTTSVGEK